MERKIKGKIPWLAFRARREPIACDTQQRKPIVFRQCSCDLHSKLSLNYSKAALSAKSRSDEEEDEIDPNHPLLLPHKKVLQLDRLVAKIIS